MTNTASLIKSIPEFYVGFKDQLNGDKPLAFLTPNGTDAAFKKRKETVDSWAKGYGHWVNGKHVYPDPIPAIVLQNVPVAGFKIADSVKRTGSWNGGNVVWRIEDPRGFEWEITSDNMAQILTQVGVEPGGVIKAPCIIARIGAINLLVPEGTDLWAKMEADNATRNTRAATKTIKALMCGDNITMRSGEKGFYLGKYRLKVKCPTNQEQFKSASSKYYYERHGGTYYEAITDEAYHLICGELSDYNRKENYYSITAYKGQPNVVSVDASKPLDIPLDIVLNSDKSYKSFAGTTNQGWEILGLAD